MVQANPSDEPHATAQQFAEPSESISCGGAFFPAQNLGANQKTLKDNVLLPTKQYSILIFKDDGSAVIYSDSLPTAQEEIEVEEPLPVIKS